MTLVVARANATGLTNATDSRACYVSRDARRPRSQSIPASPLDGVLKVVLLNHSQCVAFAGSVEVAQAAITSIAEERLHMRLDDEQAASVQEGLQLRLRRLFAPRLVRP